MLTICRTVYQRLLAEAWAVYPLEACGLLAGRAGRADRLYPIDNAWRSERAFRLDPQQQIAAFYALEEHGLEALAVYHSHPHAPAAPSAADLTLLSELAMIQVIIALADGRRPSVRAYRVAGGQAQEVALWVQP